MRRALAAATLLALLTVPVKATEPPDGNRFPGWHNRMTGYQAVREPRWAIKRKRVARQYARRKPARVTRARPPATIREAFRPRLVAVLPRPRPVEAPEPDSLAATVNEAVELAAAAIVAPANIFARFLDSLLRPAARCFEFDSLDPRVKQIVGDAARHFGAPALMTSCYRSAAYNRQVYARYRRKPTRSLHIARKAIDFKIEGVSKFALAKWVRRHKLAGGVGLYCNSIVHVDTGKVRSWNWCGGKRRVASRKRIRLAGRM
jgi:uncharacterized protein YcbK (DUF882 family)